MPESNVVTLAVLAYFHVGELAKPYRILVSYGWDGVDAQWQVIADGRCISAYGKIGMVLTMSTGAETQRVATQFPVWVPLPLRAPTARVTLRRFDACSPLLLEHLRPASNSIPCWLTLDVIVEDAASGTGTPVAPSLQTANRAAHSRAKSKGKRR